jgi:oligopeptide transport system substrate-binding protein
VKDRWIAAAMALLMALTITACSRREETKIVYDLEEEPITVDPQCASDQSAFTAINSLFEGLLTVGKDGKLKKGLAKDYTVSEDGLTYTFTLRDGLKWSNGASLTAKDFVFAFERLFDPNTASVAASSFYCIQNGQEIAQGKLDPSQVGVEALSDTQLVFHLEYPNALFLQLLTTAPAMPCNEAFFESCKGEYGLEADKLITSGPYQLTRWLHEDGGYLKLVKNENYHAAGEIDLDAISLWTCYDEEERLERFSSGTTNAYLSGKDRSDEYKEENISKLENTVWGLSFNFQKTAMQNKNFRLAVASCFDRSRYQELLSKNLTVADRVIPPGVSLDGEPYHELTAGLTGIPYNEEAAQEYYAAALNELGVNKLDLTVIMEESDQVNHETYFSYISQLIQKLDLFCTIEVLPQKDYEERIASGDYDMAVIPVKAEYNHPLSVLDAFSSGGSQNLTGYQNGAYDQLVKEVLLSPNSATVIEEAQKAEKKLLDDGIFIPLYDQSDYLITSPEVSSVFVNQENGLLTFQYAIVD